MALGVLVVSIVKGRKHWDHMQLIRKGLQGERAVGQFLDKQLNSRDCHVFHDITERNQDGTVLFNIDHVVVSRAGIFVIDTKTRYKPAKGRVNVEYDGKAVRVNGGPWDEAPIHQAMANAKHIRDVLTDMTGHENIPIRPVVLFPGWRIDGQKFNYDVWVLEAKALPKLIANGRAVIRPEDVALYQSRITMHVRNNQCIR